MLCLSIFHGVTGVRAIAATPSLSIARLRCKPITRLLALGEGSVGVSDAWSVVLSQACAHHGAPPYALFPTCCSGNMRLRVALPYFIRFTFPFNGSARSFNNMFRPRVGRTPP